jgi:hypothetical protein
MGLFGQGPPTGDGGPRVVCLWWRSGATQAVLGLARAW